MPRKLPIGISNFKKVVQGYHYIDKSLLIKDILDTSGAVLILTRPRRFGKTLNMTMLRYFFEKSPEAHASLFDGLAISKIPECMELQGRYPVIYLSFKDIKQATFDDCFQKLRAVLAKEFERLEPLVWDSLDQKNREKFERIKNEKSSVTETTSALILLTEWLQNACGEKVILLIDEYDTPIHAAHSGGYYKEGVAFVRDLLSEGLKDNPHLEMGVLTGIMRVARESFFSGLNNPAIFTVMDQPFAERFGFTESEVESLFKEYQLSEENLAGAREWYNGYRFGDSTIYNPWSILHYTSNPEAGLKPYWVNTSSNEIIRDLISDGSVDLHKDLETLLNGGSISSKLNEYVSFRDLAHSDNSVWSLMVHAGYLKTLSYRQDGLYRIYEMAVPNQEVLFFYGNSISIWLERGVNDKRLKEILRALIAGDIETFGDYLRELIVNVLSFHDTAGEKPERVYHAFVLGLLVNLEGRYRVDSNRESGYGRYDVMLIPENKNEPGLVLEFKVFDARREKDESTALNSALQQIKDKDYAARLRAEGVKDILGVGIVFDGKHVHLDSVYL